MADVSVERLAHKILEQYATEVAKVRSKLVSLINRLRAMDLEGWRREVRELVHWIERETDAMESAEKNVAILKAAGRGATVLGGAMAGLGIAGSLMQLLPYGTGRVAAILVEARDGLGITGSVFTFGLTASLALAGLAVWGAGAATSVGGNAVSHSIAGKTCEMKSRCESFEQSSASIVGALRELSEAMTTLRLLFQWQLKQQEQKQSAKDINSSAVYAIVLGETDEKIAGLNAQTVALVVDDIAVLRKRISTSIFGAGRMGDLKDATVTLQNGGSQAKLMRADVSTFRHTIKDIEGAFLKLHLM